MEPPFLPGLADTIVRTGTSEYVLVIGVELLSRFLHVDWIYRLKNAAGRRIGFIRTFEDGTGAVPLR